MGIGDNGPMREMSYRCVEIAYAVKNLTLARTRIGGPCNDPRYRHDLMCDKAGTSGHLAAGRRMQQNINAQRNAAQQLMHSLLEPPQSETARVYRLRMKNSEQRARPGFHLKYPNNLQGFANCLSDIIAGGQDLEEVDSLFPRLDEDAVVFSFNGLPLVQTLDGGKEIAAECFDAYPSQLQVPMYDAVLRLNTAMELYNNGEIVKAQRRFVSSLSILGSLRHLLNYEEQYCKKVGSYVNPLLEVGTLIDEALAVSAQISDEIILLNQQQHHTTLPPGKAVLEVPSGEAVLEVPSGGAVMEILSERAVTARCRRVRH